MPPVYKWCKMNSSKHNHVKNGRRKINILFYFILFYSILFRFYFFYSIIIVQKSRVYPTLFGVTISIKSRLFLKNSSLFSWIPFCIEGKSRLFKSTRKKVDSV
jgi:hypothetical protein